MLSNAKDTGKKNSDEYKAKDVLRKKQSRMLLKINADAYADHKREKERKCYAKIRKNYTTVTTNTSLQEPLQPVSTLFSNPAIKSRSIKKIEKIPVKESISIFLYFIKTFIIFFR